MLSIDQLDKVLPDTELLVMSLPGTPETEGILSRARVALLPEGAYIVNVGRGSAIDYDALTESLNNMWWIRIRVIRNEKICISKRTVYM